MSNTIVHSASSATLFTVGADTMGMGTVTVLPIGFSSLGASIELSGLEHG